jgi:uncharacterized protein YjiS (DUF1127 family)
MWFITPQIETRRHRELVLPVATRAAIRRRFPKPQPMEITMTFISITERSTGSASTSFSGHMSVAGRRFGLQWLFNVAAGFVERVQRNRAIAELHGLNDQLLKDIGISRCEIWYRVNHPQER